MMRSSPIPAALTHAADCVLGLTGGVTVRPEIPHGVGFGGVARQWAGGGSRLHRIWR